MKKDLDLYKKYLNLAAPNNGKLPYYISHNIVQENKKDMAENKPMQHFDGSDGSVVLNAGSQYSDPMDKMNSDVDYNTDKAKNDKTLVSKLADLFNNLVTNHPQAASPVPTPGPTLDQKYQQIRNQNTANFQNPGNQQFASGGIVGLEKTVQYADGGKVEHDKKNLLELKAAFDKFLNEESKEKMSGGGLVSSPTHNWADGGKVGSGERFAKLENKLSHQKGVTDPGALAASIGRKKYGNKKMNKMAQAHMDEGGQIDSQEDINNRSIGNMFDSKAKDTVSDLVKQGLPNYDDGGQVDPDTAGIPGYQDRFNSLKTVRPDLDDDQIKQVIIASQAAQPSGHPAPSYSGAGQASAPQGSGAMAPAVTQQLNQLQASNNMPGQYKGGKIKHYDDGGTVDDSSDPSTLQQIYNAIQSKYQNLTAPSYGSGMGDVQSADAAGRALPVVTQGFGADDNLAQQLQTGNRDVAIAGGPAKNVSQQDVDNAKMAQSIAMGSVGGLSDSEAAKMADHIGGIAPDASLSLKLKKLFSLPHGSEAYTNLSNNMMEDLSLHGEAGKPYVLVKDPNSNRIMRLSTEDGSLEEHKYAHGGMAHLADGTDPVTGNVDPNSPEGLAMIAQSQYPQAPAVPEEEQVSDEDPEYIQADLPAKEDAVEESENPDDKAVEEEMANEDFKAAENADEPDDSRKLADVKEESEDDSKEPDEDDVDELKNGDSEKSEEDKSDDKDQELAEDLIAAERLPKNDLAQAQKERDQNIAEQMIAKGGALAGAGIASRSGAKTDPSQVLNVLAEGDKYVNLPVQKYAEQIENQQNDPNSAVSKVVKAYMTNKGFKVPDGASAADLFKVAPFLQKDAGLQNAMQRAMLSAQTKIATNKNSVDSANQRAQESIKAAKERQLLANQGKLAAEKQKQTTKDAVTEQKAEQAMTNARSKPALGMAQKNLVYLANMNKMLEDYGDPNKWTPAQVAAWNTEKAKVAQGGTPTEGMINELSNPTYGSKMAELVQKFTATPTGAGQGKFIAQDMKYINGLRDVAQGVIKSNIGDVAKSYQAGLDPQAYKNLIYRHSDMLNLYSPKEERGINAVMQAKGLSRQDAIKALINQNLIKDVNY